MRGCRGSGEGHVFVGMAGNWGAVGVELVVVY